MMRLLLTNDDGINAPGLVALAQALETDGHQVFIVAPQGERSTCGHSMTLSKPIEVHQKGPRRWAVDGFPADCVLWAVNYLLPHQKIDALLAGINNGGNMAQDLYYSGTVAAAREGMQLGIPSLALSLAVSFAKLFKTSRAKSKQMTPLGAAVDLAKDKKFSFAHQGMGEITSAPAPDFSSAAAWIAQFLHHRLIKSDFKDCFLNLNFPDCPLSQYQGIKIVRPGYINYDKHITPCPPLRRKHFFWIGGSTCHPVLTPQTDVWAVKNKYIAASWVKLAAPLAESRLSPNATAKVWKKMFSSGITRK